jgi:hypothetical protein
VVEKEVLSQPPRYTHLPVRFATLTGSGVTDVSGKVSISVAKLLTHLSVVHRVFRLFKPTLIVTSKQASAVILGGSVAGETIAGSGIDLKLDVWSHDANGQASPRKPFAFVLHFGYLPSPFDADSGPPFDGH